MQNSVWLVRLLTYLAFGMLWALGMVPKFRGWFRRGEIHLDPFATIMLLILLGLLFDLWHSLRRRTK
ncbi:MAG: hypothetical protein ACE5JX_05085 [Acidobacteriota bacterium]